MASSNTVLCKFDQESNKAVGKVVEGRSGEPRYGIHRFAVVQLALNFKQSEQKLAYLSCNLVTQYRFLANGQVELARSPVQLVKVEGSKNEQKVIDGQQLNFLAEPMGRLEFELRNLADDSQLRNVEFSVLVGFEKM